MAGMMGSFPFQQFARRSRIPTRYASANIFNLASPTPSYADAVDTLLSTYAHPASERLAGCFSTKPHAPGAIIGIVGQRGTGKTHLACALLNLFNSASLGQVSHYRRAIDIFTEIKSTFGRASADTAGRILDELEECPLLVIDEMQVRSSTPWENDQITSLVDSRYANLRPTVLIANLQAGELIDSLGPSIESRMTETGQIIVADWPSFRG